MLEQAIARMATLPGEIRSPSQVSVRWGFVDQALEDGRAQRTLDRSSSYAT